MARSSVTAALPQIDILAGLGKGLTHKQRRFAEEIAMGKKGSEAYRAAYNTRATPQRVAVEASKLRHTPKIADAVQAIQQAQEAMKYQTSEGLRSLAVSSLVNVLIDPETSQAVKVQAARTIGNMTEVSLFTHRTESKVIHSSDDIKAKILREIGALMNGQAEDVVERDALSLLTELTAPEISADGEPTAPAPPLDGEQESLVPLHTIPQPQSKNSSQPQSENSSQEDPPISDFDQA